MPQYLILTGTLSAERESDVAANASGQVTATFVERGQEVKKGQMLATLDARLLSLSEQAAAAQSELAKSQASLAEFECERGKRLFEDHAIS